MTRCLKTNIPTIGASHSLGLSAFQLCQKIATGTNAGNYVSKPTLIEPLIIHAIATICQVPHELELQGHRIDLSPLQAVVEPFRSAMHSASEAIAGLAAPELSVEMPSFLLISYLDSNLQVLRDNNGGVFAMVKDEELFHIPRLGLRD